MKKIFIYLLSFAFLFLISQVSIESTYAEIYDSIPVNFNDRNSGTNWEVIWRLGWYKTSRDKKPEEPRINRYSWSESGSTSIVRTRPYPWHHYFVHWSTQCKDPYNDVVLDNCNLIGGDLICTFTFIKDVSYKVGGTGDGLGPVQYTGTTGDEFTVPASACPANCNPRSCGSACGTIGDGCGGTLNCGGCGSNYCGGDIPRANCELINPSCGGSNSCNFSDRLTYAAACNDPTGGNDGGNRCAPPPPGNRTDSAFCQGPAGTNKAAGINMNWNAILFPNNGVGTNADPNTYDLQLRQVGGGDLHTWDGNATQYSFPGNGCTSGPGGCSLPYNIRYEWRVRGHTSNGRSGPTDWTGWSNPITTNDCSGKPDLRIPPGGFTFPGGNSAGTSVATVTVENIGVQGTGADFNIRVDNGSGSLATTSTGALGAGVSRTVSVPVNPPNIPRPNAGSYTATATVDSGRNINESDETNNDRSNPYNTTSNVSGYVFIDSSGVRGVKDGTDTFYQGSGIVRVEGVNYSTNASGVYTSAELGPGTKTVSINLPANYIVTTGNNPTSVVLGPNRTVDFGIVQNLYSITGKVWVDNNNDGALNGADADYSGLTVTLTGCGGGNATTTATDITPGVNYQLLNKTTGTCTVSIPAAVTGYTVPVTSQSVTIGPNKTGVNFRLVPRSIVNIHVYNDYNGNSVQDCVNPLAAYPTCTGSSAETGSAGRTVTVTSGGAGTYTTNASGNVQLTNLLPGSSTSTVTIPGGWTLTTPPNSKTVSYPPSPVQSNFGIRPPGPTCTSLTVSPTTAVNYSGQTRTLTATCTNPSGGVLTYNWNAETGTVPSSSATNSVTWTATAGTMTGDLNETVATQACDSLTGICSASIQASIPIVPLYSISGNVFEDVNKNGKKVVDNDINYLGTITITRNPANGSTAYPTPGEYTISNLPAGNYTIAYTNLPSGYESIYPPFNSFNVTVGAGCNTNDGRVPPEATCANGNISNLNYAIIYGSPWIQSQGSDIWFNNGFSNSIPSGASCQSYASLAGPGGTPGIVYSGIGSADFGNGQASANPYNWKVGGISSYSESYGPASSGSPLATSYSSIKNLATTNGTPPTALTTAQCGANGIASCRLSPALASGVYEAVGDLTGDLTLVDNNYQFPSGRNYVILVTGNLRLNGTIDVPVGSTVLFSVKGNIYVDPSVGTATVTSTTPHLEGWFSTDHSFYVEGDKTCPARDNRLNVEGAIIVNASLTGGSFYNQRDLCSGNSNCPVFYIKERPDFSLNAPRFIKNAPRVYKEVAP